MAITCTATKIKGPKGKYFYKVLFVIFSKIFFSTFCPKSLMSNNSETKKIDIFEKKISKKEFFH